MAVLPPAPATTSTSSQSSSLSSASSEDQTITKTTAIFQNASNLHKALEDHGIQTKFDDAILAYDPTPPALTFSCDRALERGEKPSMEDFVLLEETADYLLGGIFDGHAGPDAAEFSTTHFSACFFIELKKTPDNVKSALTRAMAKLHTQILANKITSGTTACVCYIDKSDNTLYVATLGDCEAKLYRKKDNKTLSIPLSCIRNWASPKDMTDHVCFRGKSVTQEELTKDPKRFNPKLLRNLPGGFGLNISRSLGDEGWKDLKQKPKVTGPIQLLPDDTVVVGSDGVWDFVDDESLEKKVINPFQAGGSLAQEVVDYAYVTRGSRDNLSALAIKAAKAKGS